ncbi:hypothetical protein [Cyanobium sp. Morenito 9A2]|uniref:O-linked N-acetylglucosamine transferase, SPINDLY family protein n=1 Tax=Cyanobium sp. Morenito 9A2 TaxID=2823718 RepID=UPI0020CC6E6E|nr:hypothetical protein [Cyanobium sp. Morenito 9A2]MCP9848810.1 hypothetical protein [Cyanobium sp. Morenito 9A2]
MSELDPSEKLTLGAEEARSLLQHGIELAADGAHQEARQTFLLVLERDPHSALAWDRLGQTLGHLGLLGEAAQALKCAAELDPSNIECRSALGFLYRSISRPDEAIHWHSEALALRPNSLILQLNHAFVLPVVASSTEQISNLRKRCLALMDAIVKDECTECMPTTLTCHPFYLSTHNQNDRPLLEAYGRLMVRSFGDQSAASEVYVNPGQTSSRKIRVGFLSGCFYDHSVTRAFEGLIRHLDRDQIEVVLIHLADAKHDATTDRLESCCQEVVRLSGSLDESTERLRALTLDVLFFTDIGTHPAMTQLAARRHAPLQVTGWGWPQTSGMPFVDAYISGDLVEPEMGQDHYSERLIRLPGLPCCFPSDAIEGSLLTRDYFFLPPDDALIGCLQSLEKIHPDFDAVLERLALDAPKAWFVFVESEVTSSTEIFLNRMAEQAPSVSERLILLGRMSRKDFFGLAGCIDVLLDPIYFGSGITLFETLHAGTPTVTLEGKFLRTRMVAAAYRLMGVSQPPIAQTLDEYVKLAAQISNNPAIRSSLRQEIQEKAQSNLYDRMEFVRGFENFVLESARGIVQDLASRTRV